MNRSRPSIIFKFICLILKLVKLRFDFDVVLQVGELYVDVERQNARHFAQTLFKLVPSLLSLRSSIEVDEALQEFASRYCQDLATQQQLQTTDNSGISSTHQLALISIINADGIYLATYSSLLLNLKLIKMGFYQQDIKPVPLTEVSN